MVFHTEPFCLGRKAQNRKPPRRWAAASVISEPELQSPCNYVSREMQFWTLDMPKRLKYSANLQEVFLHGIIESYHWKVESGQNSAKSLKMRYLRIANLQGHLRNI